MIKNLNDLLKVIKQAKTSKQAYKDLIQESIVFFVSEYNGCLSYNTTPFKAIVETVGKDVKDFRQWLFKYTNITSVKSDLLHFETSDFEFIKDKDGKDKKVFTLSFNDSFNGQKWYETEKETDSQAIKELTSEDLQKSLKALYKKYTKQETTFDETETKILKAIKNAYQL